VIHSSYEHGSFSRGLDSFFAELVMRPATPYARLTVKLRNFNRLLPLNHLVLRANRLAFQTMNSTHAYADRAGLADPHASLTPWIAAGMGVLGFAFLASLSGPSIGLAAMVLLSITGLFFVFGVLAGYVQIDVGSPRGHIERAVAADSAVGLEVTAADGEVLFSNGAALALRGASAGSIEAALAGSSLSADAAYRLARAAERFETLTEVVARPGATSDALPRWYRVTVQPFHAPAFVSDGRRMVQWRVVDISEDRQREACLNENLAARDAFLDQLPVGIATIGADGAIQQTNADLRRLLGFDERTLRTLSLNDILPVGIADLVLAAGRAAQASPRMLPVDLVCEDGKAVPVRLVMQAAKDGQWTMIALREARDAQSAGPASGVQRLLNAAPFGMATIDQNGAIITSNSTFQRMFPTQDGTPVSLIARLTANASADQRKTVEAAIVRALAGRVSSAPVDIVAGDAALTARSLHINPLTAGVDPREAAIIYVADATEHKALELKFAQSQRMEAVGKLAGGIAHDFNNVLTVIIGLSDLLLQTRRPTDSGYADLIQIRDNARRAANMVKQLLAFSRKQTLEPEVIGVNELLQDFAFTFKKTIGERIDVRHVPMRDLWTVKADRTQLDQVLLNLAVNAKDAMPEGGRLRLRAKNISERESLKFGGVGMQAGEYVLIEVEDSGSGMTADVMTKIFEPFFTTKDVGKGTGLGLSTVYGIIKQTGGFIYPISELGRGTTFRVFLPRHNVTAEEVAEAAAAVEAKKKEAPRDLTGTGRVLLVEDEDGVRSFAVRALQRQGYEVLEAISGVEALEVLAEAGGKVDLIVSDVIMPEMDGPTMYNEMLKIWPDLKIIFMSGYPSDAFERALDPKAEFAFLQKPVNLVQLAAKVKEVITS
jgi:two-component system, cell cycle sensor histidine kinase and response regulator CckA